MLVSNGSKLHAKIGKKILGEQNTLALFKRKGVMAQCRQRVERSGELLVLFGVLCSHSRRSSLLDYNSFDRFSRILQSQPNYKHPPRLSRSCASRAMTVIRTRPDSRGLIR